MHQILSQRPPAPSAVQPGVSPALDAVCRRCLEQEPQRRYPSAEALADDLRRVLEGRPVEADSVPPAAATAEGSMPGGHSAPVGQPHPGAVSRRLLVLIVLACGALAALGAGALLWLR
jgi:hypothetical protein